MVWIEEQKVMRLSMRGCMSRVMLGHSIVTTDLGNMCHQAYSAMQYLVVYMVDGSLTCTSIGC